MLRTLACFGVLLLIAAPASALTQTHTLDWIRQFGTNNADYAYDIAVDSAGNTYVTGWTSVFQPADNDGSPGNSFLTRYNADGTHAWTDYFGSNGKDRAYGVDVDAAGNVYLAGWTDGDLATPNLGVWDAFLARYNPDGTRSWTRQLGTASFDHGNGVAVDAAGHIYITGFTSGDLGGVHQGRGDAYLARYDSNGTLLWNRQLGSTLLDSSFGVAVDGAGNAYITGKTVNNLGGTHSGLEDAFLARYNADGTHVWTQQLGSSEDDISESVAVDADGNIFITGYTEGGINGPHIGSNTFHDAFLARYNADGTLDWTQQFGTGSLDRAFAVAVDAQGNAYVTGDTFGRFVGDGAGSYDLIIARFGPDGTLEWAEQIGTRSQEYGTGIDVDDAGNLYITGYTSGRFGERSFDNWDPFVVKYVIPEPGSLALLSLGGLIVARRRR